MAKLKVKSCILNDEDVEVYYQTADFEQGGHDSPTFAAETTICMVEKKGVEIGTTIEQDEELINQILN